MTKNLVEIAKHLDAAATSATAVPQISISTPIDLPESYEIQKISIDQRLERGEKLLGYKLGFTSKAKMEQMGVHELIWGRLTDSMFLENGGVLDIDKFIHPRAEPEIAFLIGKDITGPISNQEALNYLEAVTTAIEIIDSRYKDFKFSLEDVIADNCSSSAYVLGEWKSPETKIDDLDIKLIINEETVQEGNSNAILGHPINSLIEASTILTRNGETIKEGMVLLAGAATPASYLSKGDKVLMQSQFFDKIEFRIK